MTRSVFPKAALALLLLPLGLMAADPAFNGRWRLELDRSTALDGWTTMDLVVSVEGDEVALQHDMRWRSTRVTEINRVNTVKPVGLKNFFRIDQRHMAVYRPKESVTPVRAEWLDEGRTLRVEADVAVEVSQGMASIRIYSEYRLQEGDETLTLIEFSDREIMAELLQHSDLKTLLTPFPTTDRALAVVATEKLSQVQEILTQIGVRVKDKLQP